MWYPTNQSHSMLQDDLVLLVFAQHRCFLTQLILDGFCRETTSSIKFVVLEFHSSKGCGFLANSGSGSKIVICIARKFRLSKRIDSVTMYCSSPFADFFKPVVAPLVPFIFPALSKRKRVFR